jgi:microfibrillar-associated protein 1
MMRPKFVRRADHVGSAGGRGQDAHVGAEGAGEEEEEARRRAAADELVEEQIRKQAAARAAGKKHWDDESDPEADVDDTDDVDPEAEYAAWKLRELKRIRRERDAIEAREKEREEVERRRNLTEEDRRAEDDAFLARQREEKDARGKMAYMQKYFHKGAFYSDVSKAEGLDGRDIMGSRFADDARNRELLPKALQMRDMTKLGRKGATKYKDLKSEDTGRWGELDDGRPRRSYDRFADERFQPGRDRRDARDGGGEGQGANAMPLGERKPLSGAADSPRDGRSGEGGERHRDSDRDADRRGDDDRRRDRYGPRDDNRTRRRSRSRSPRQDNRDRHGYRDRRREWDSSGERDHYENDRRRRVDAR